MYKAQNPRDAWHVFFSYKKNKRPEKGNTYGAIIKMYYFAYELKTQ